MTAVMLWTEVRRSPLRWWLPVLIALDVAMLFGRSTWWIGVWPEASAAAQLPAYFFGMVLGGGAAWTAGRVHRAGIAEQLAAAARLRWPAELLLLSSTLIYGLVAYAPGVMIAAVVSAPHAGPGFLWLSYLGIGVCLVVLSASAGHLAGKLWSSRFVPPIAVAICLFGQTVLRPVRFYVLSGHVQVEIAATAFATRFAFALVMAVLAVTIPARAVHRDTRGTPAGVLRPLAAVTVMAGLVMIAMAGPLQVTRAAPSQPLCSAAKPRVCLWPEEGRYVGLVSAMAARLAALPGGGLKLPETFYEAGLRDPAIPDAAADFRLLEGGVSVPSFLSSAVLNSTLPVCDVPAANSEKFTHEAFRLDAYLQVRSYGTAEALGSGGGPPGVDMREIADVAHRPERVQAQWVSDRLAAIRRAGENCRDR
ncbi:hypothetical protein [Sphaerisporangium sp. NPDC051011]|uniref:hypothetical protein n=1 Tax=Sphaerisporangium sp. NPDC051011 TaxID=3155792 RepID=UPI0033C39175